MKSEPETYPWSQLVQEGRTAWTGVRNFQARNHLRAMRAGDGVFFHHSGREKQVVGLARVVKAAYPDPTAREGDWSCVDLAVGAVLESPVSLAVIKADATLRGLPMVKFSRISVTPVTAAQARRLLALGRRRAE